jgi:hypothetical protein
MSSVTCVLRTITWDYFTSRHGLPDRFIRSPKEVKEAIITDVNDLQEFWMTSSDGASDGAVGASFFAMRRLFEILQKCFDKLGVCFDIIFVFAITVDLADNNLQMPNSWIYSSQLDLDRSRAKLKILLDGSRTMFDQSLSESKDLGDILRLLPGVVVQRRMSMQGMADLYRIKPDLLERLIKSPFELLRLYNALYFPHYYTLDDYSSGFLQDRDRSQLHYCDPIVQHISICRHFLSLLGKSNAFDLQS